MTAEIALRNIADIGQEVKKNESCRARFGCGLRRNSVRFIHVLTCAHMSHVNLACNCTAIEILGSHFDCQQLSEVDRKLTV